MLLQHRIRSNRKNVLLGALAFLLLTISGSGQQQAFKSSPFNDGEWLKYKVKWGFIRLGTLEFFQERVQDAHGPVYRVTMRAKSAKLPFIKIHFVNECLLNALQPVLSDFSIKIGKEAENVTTYRYHPHSNTVIMTKVLHEEVVRIDSLSDDDKLYDAVGTFMMIRCLSASERKHVLKNVIDFDVKRTHLDFSDEVESIKVAAFDEKQKGLKYTGMADFEGKAYAGINGPFKGWISTDEAAIPLKTKVKIFLGSITIELEDYRREPEKEPKTDSGLWYTENTIPACH